MKNKTFKLLLLSTLGMSIISGCDLSTTNSSPTNNNSTPTTSTNDNSTTSNSTSSNSTSDSSKNDDAVTLTKISFVPSLEVKYEYNIGEELDLTNVKIKLTYSDDTYETIDVTIDMVTPVDMSSAGYKTVYINYGGLQASYSIEVKNNTTPVEKQDPVINFDFDPGTKFTIGSDVKPGVSITPNTLDYVVSYSSDTTGYNSEEYPTEPGTYSIVVDVTGNNEYNSISDHQWFQLVAPSTLPKPEIVFDFDPGTKFTIGSDVKPGVTVSEGADYTIHYSSDTTGYNSTEYPTEPGTYSIVVTVNDNENYSGDFKHQWFVLVANAA